MKSGRFLAVGAVLGAWFVWSRRAASFPHLHAELRSPLLRFRSPPFTPGVVRLMQAVQAHTKAPALPNGVRVEECRIPGPPGAPDVTVFVYRPPNLPAGAAAILNIHGGGYVTGSAAAYHAQSAAYALELGVVVVGVEYRLAPGTPFPGPLEDCYAALTWMAREAASLGLEPARIALVGDSAGGGLAAALAQLAHDRGEVTPAFQLLYYPMLDDRTALRVHLAANLQPGGLDGVPGRPTPAGRGPGVRRASPAGGPERPAARVDRGGHPGPVSR